MPSQLRWLHNRNSLRDLIFKIKMRIQTDQIAHFQMLQNLQNVRIMFSGGGESSQSESKPVVVESQEQLNSILNGLRKF